MSLSEDRFLVYHGTSRNCVRKILKEKRILGEWGLGGHPFGVGFCTTISRAMNFAGRKCMKYGVGGCRREARIVCFYLERSMFEVAEREHVEDAFTMQTSDGDHPLKEFKLDHEPMILTIPQAEKYF